MEQKKEKKQYDTKLTPAIRYNKNISYFAMVIYSELDNLDNKEGYAYISNLRLANLYSTSERSISRVITELERAGLIRVEVTRKKVEKGRIKSERKIYLTSPHDNSVKKEKQEPADRTTDLSNEPSTARQDCLPTAGQSCPQPDVKVDVYKSLKEKEEKEKNINSKAKNEKQSSTSVEEYYDKLADSCFKKYKELVSESDYEYFHNTIRRNIPPFIEGELATIGYTLDEIKDKLKIKNSEMVDYFHKFMEANVSEVELPF